MIGEHCFEQRDATPIFREAMTNAHTAHRIAQHSGLVGAHRAARRARNIVLGRLGKDFQFGNYILVHNNQQTGQSVSAWFHRGETKVLLQ